jgi:hypothetical protein
MLHKTDKFMPPDVAVEMLQVAGRSNGIIIEILPF